MLTSDLIQVRRQRGEIRPRYIDTSDDGHRDLADQLVTLVADHQGKRRAELDSALRELLGTGTAFLLHRGLAKLLLDRCEFETQAPEEPTRLREVVFRHAAAQWQQGDQPFDRDRALVQAADELASDLPVVEASLYGDLKGEQVLTSWKSCTADWLLNRYNVALAQGVLLRAQQLTLEVPPQNPRRHRALFRKIKFFQLMASVSGSPEAGYRIRLDGPLSVLKASQRYGLRMATFLPTLLHFSGWRLEAEVTWGKQRREASFRLSPDQGLAPINRLTGQWLPDALSDLATRFTALGSDWTVSEDAALLDLGGQGVLVPDLVFRHPEGCEAYLETFGFWNRSALESRLALLAEHGPRHLVLALSKGLATDREELEELPGEVLVFRSRPLPRKILERLESLRTDQEPS
ncbi:MAG: DUF790 family protein [Acidobacteriota bacterium]